MLLPAEVAWYVTGRFYRKTDLSLADYGYVLEVGKIVTSGSGSELLSSDEVRKAYLGED